MITSLIMIIINESTDDMHFCHRAIQMSRKHETLNITESRGRVPRTRLHLIVKTNEERWDPFWACTQPGTVHLATLSAEDPRP